MYVCPCCFFKSPFIVWAAHSAKPFEARQCGANVKGRIPFKMPKELNSKLEEQVLLSLTITSGKLWMANNCFNSLVMICVAVKCIS